MFEHARAVHVVIVPAAMSAGYATRIPETTGTVALGTLRGSQTRIDRSGVCAYKRHDKVATLLLTTEGYGERPLPACTGDEPYVFICYAHEDSDIVYPEIARPNVLRQVPGGARTLLLYRRGGVAARKQNAPSRDSPATNANPLS